MNKLKCEVCMGFGMEKAHLVLHEETCSSCNGKGFFDSPEDAVDHSVESFTYSSPDWKKVSKEFIKYQKIRIRSNF
ncbi:hypothetical protein [Salinimicrobium sp. GXAS 041]|uniref:hypothetical protein n=1 Tax=Salinimicrobium sp. GXAS 041 TaxID=3400806 RepID=UPI003C70CB62